MANQPKIVSAGPNEGAAPNIAEHEAEISTQIAALNHMTEILAANPQVLTAAIEKLDTKTLSDLRKRMGAAPVTRKRRRRNVNQDARNFVKAYGDATHADGFEPVPPDWVVERDRSNPGFKDAWMDKWRDGHTTSGLEMELDEDRIQAEVMM